MLEGAKEPVGVGQRQRIIGPDIIPVDQSVDGRQGARHTQGGVRPPVDQLEQLHRELDIANSPWGAFDVVVVGFLLGSLLEFAQLPDGLGAQLPDEVVDHLPKAIAEVGIAGGGAGLQQSLELPRLTPALVVSPIAGKRSHQRPGDALGSQTDVDSKSESLRRWRRELVDEARGEPDCRAQIPVGGLGDEHEVDVGGIVELLRPPFAEGD